MDPPPPHSRSSSYTSIPILAISLLGILTTAILLLSYYLFIINCCLHWRRSHLLPFRRVRRHAAEPARAVPLHNPHEVLHGLDPAAIRSIPTLRFSSAGKQGGHVECAVCLVEFEERELLRILQGCSHSFHVDCIDTWLQSSANCPLCRFDISRAPIHNFPFPDLERDSGVRVVVIEVADGYNAGGTETEVRTPPIRTTTPKVSKQMKLWQVASMGDECIDISREKDERFRVQPIRRSFSMDSSNDRSLFLSVQKEMLQQQNREVLRDVCRGEGTSSSGTNGGGGGGNASGRIRRSFFSFGRSSRSTTAVLPEQSELC